MVLCVQIYCEKYAQRMVFLNVSIQFSNCSVTGVMASPRMSGRLSVHIFLSRADLRNPRACTCVDVPFEGYNLWPIFLPSILRSLLTLINVWRKVLFPSDIS